MTEQQNNKKNLYIKFSYFMSKQRVKILKKQIVKLERKKQNSNDEIYVQKKTNLDTKVHNYEKLKTFL